MRGLDPVVDSVSLYQLPGHVCPAAKRESQTLAFSRCAFGSRLLKTECCYSFAEVEKISARAVFTAANRDKPSGPKPLELLSSGSDL